MDETSTPGFSPGFAIFAFICERAFLCFWVLTVPFTVMLLYFMIQAQRKKVNDLATPFFKICIAAAIIDLITLLNNYFGSVFPKFGLAVDLYESLGRPFLYLYFYLAWATGVCQAMSVSVMATNRLSAMLFPETYHKMWRGNKLRFAIGLQFVPGMLASLHNFTNLPVWMRTDSGALVPEIPDKVVTKWYFSIGGGFLGLNCLYLIYAYAFLFYVLKKRHKTALSNSARIDNLRHVTRRREYRLFLMSSCIVAVQLAIFTFFASKVFPWMPLTLDQFYVFYSALSDIYSGINPYLLWIFSDALREYVLKSLGFGNSRESVVVTSLSSQIRQS